MGALTELKFKADIGEQEKGLDGMGGIRYGDKGNICVIWELIQLNEAEVARKHFMFSQGCSKDP